MTFSRYTAPTYPDAPSIPAGPSTVVFDGVNYRFINVISGGTGASGSAFVDGAKAAGPNAGTFMVAFGEDALSSHANRGLRALAENTDHLDDLFHRPIAVTARTNNATAVGPVTSILLPAGAYVGNSGLYPMDMLFSIVDSDDNEILDPATSVKVEVASITGASVGDGFASGAITLNLSVAIPNGVTYRVYYGEQTNLASLPTDAFTFVKIRGAEEVSGGVEDILRRIQSPNPPGYEWNTTPDTTLYDAARTGLDDRYRRKGETSTVAPTRHPVPFDVDTAGSGSWYFKDGVGFGGYTYLEFGTVNDNYLSSVEAFLGATWFANLEDFFDPNATTDRAAATSGFVVIGQRQAHFSGDYAPNLFSFAHFSRRASSGADANLATNIIANSAATLTGDTLTLSAPQCTFRDFGSGAVSGLALNHDVIVVRYNGDDVHLVIWGIDTLDATKLRVRRVDGSVLNYPGTIAVTVIDWLSPAFFVSDGAVNWHERSTGSGASTLVKHQGMFYCSPPKNRYGVGDSSFQLEEEPFSVYASSDLSAATALSWGGYDNNDPTLDGMRFRKKGHLRGDGSISTSGNISGAGMIGTYFRNSATQVQNSNAPSVDIRDGAMVRVNAGAGNVALTVQGLSDGHTLEMIVNKSAGAITDTMSVTATDTNSNAVSVAIWDDPSANAVTFSTFDEGNTSYIYRGVMHRGAGGTLYLLLVRHTLGILI